MPLFSGYDERFKKAFKPATFTGAGPTVGLAVDGLKELIEALNISIAELKGILASANPLLQEKADLTIVNTLIAAGGKGGASFPQQYAIQMGIIAGQNNLTTSFINGDTVGVEIDLEKLGTKEDLTKAYHYGADYRDQGEDSGTTRGPKGRFTKSQSGRVVLPWTGGDNDASLANDVQTRYEFWYALFNGQPYNGIDTSELWPETVKQRVNLWYSMGKAPQWLLLQYGQTEWEPVIRPQPIIETITNTMNFIVYELFERIFTELINRIDKTSYVTAYQADIEGADPAFKIGKLASHATKYSRGRDVMNLITTSFVDDVVIIDLIRKGLG